MQRKIAIPSPEEDAIINAGIADGPDTFELGDEWFAGAKPSHEAVPHILERYRRSRGKQKEPTKTAIHIRLDADIVDWFKNGAEGERGYQTRINQVLREYIAQHEANMVTLEQMPEKAQAILLASVTETGPAHRLIVAVDTLDGSMHVIAGNKQWTANRDEAPYFKAAIDYLNRNRLIKRVPNKGYYVTDAGYRVVSNVQDHS